MNYPGTKLFSAALLTAALSLSTASAVTLDIPGAAGDQEIREDGSSVWVGQTTIRIGGSDTTNDRDSVGILFFELPELDENAFISDASLTVGLVKIQSVLHNLVPDGEVDVYGLGYRSTATALATDYFAGPLDPSATLLQSSFITFGSPEGANLTTDAAASAGIASYLNSLYTAGAVAGDFAAFRLNPDVEDETSNRYYEIASASNVDEGMRPYMTITTVPEPSTTAALLGLGALGFCILRRRTK